MSDKISLLINEIRSSRDWFGSASGLAEKVNSLLSKAALSLEPYGRNGVIAYRQIGVLSAPEGKQFTWRHILELAAARRLADVRWSRKQLADWIPHQAPENLLEAIRAPMSASEHLGISVSRETRERAEQAVRLLAIAVVEVYRACRGGDVLIQGPLLPHAMYLAMLRLGALKVSAGLVDEFGSVHDVLARCRETFASGAWNLPVFEDPQFAFAGVRLLDPATRLPTIDAVEMARLARNELDLLEQLAFEELRATSDRFVGRAPEVYTILRRFIAEHAITTVDEIRVYQRSQAIQLAVAFINSCYESVQPHHLVNGGLYRCKSCRTPMRAARVTGKVACVIPQCVGFEEPVDPTLVRSEHGANTRIARPHVMTYWIGPAIDELAIARKAENLSLPYMLYPDFDSCDISFDGGKTGIDVKSHSNAFVLAEALSKKPGLLSFYEKKIVAINDQSLKRFPNYLEVLKREYRGGSDIEFLSMSALLKRMKAIE
ncbi:hypothetical protein [Stagnimonas aquatica]|uniref:restriction endonuclease-related protein n=1 Tax=Stagnimonas aquatica TaxID=2689987 RepID=UPI0011CDC1F5|nr:hypothetical protein [Stagnimonas aquatica]